MIVPVDHVHTIVQTLETFGSRVGLDKSFWTGMFRESCGREYFNGTDVSLVRVRQALPDTIADAAGVISTVSLRNQLYIAGYWKTVRWLDSYIGKVIKHFPYVLPTSPVLGRVSFLGYQSERMHPYLHSPLVRGYVVEGKAPSDELGDTGALLKCLLRLEAGNTLRGVESNLDLVPCYRSGLAHAKDSGPSSWSPTASYDGKHLERSGRPQRVSIKLGWRSPV